MVHLKGFLRQLGLPVSGKKDVLIERLRASRGDAATSSFASSETDLIEDAASCPTSLSRGSTVEGGGAAEVSSGGGVAPQGLTLRERLEARVRDREAARQAEALPSSQRVDGAEGSKRGSSVGVSGSIRGGTGSSSSGVGDGGGGTGNDNGSDRAKKIQSRPTVDDDRSSSSAKHGKKSIGSSLQSGAKVGGTKPLTGAPMSRRPLGALVQGNTRIGSNSSGNSRDGFEGKGFKPLKQKAGRTVVATAPKQTGGSTGSSGGGVDGGGRASVPRKVGSVPSAGTAGEGGVKRPRPVVRPGTEINGVPVVNSGKNDRPRNMRDTGAGSSNSSTGGGGRNGSVGVKVSGAVSVGSSHQAKRVRVEGSAKPTTTPSFLKPTKSSGAHVSAALQSRSGGGGSGAGDAQ